ncbi:hypothetical protein CPC08DRAFT_194662 [Agrocybe pediades]|nr:hypothetical protein CPC08DRAFT_194662 [Agrocybe pediades]
MAAPATAHHYIRTIHTSFTNAASHQIHSSTHHQTSSSAHAAAAAWASTNLNHHFNVDNYGSRPRSSSSYHAAQQAAYSTPKPTPQAQQNISISTHNAHMYAHHLRDLTNSGTGVVAGGKQVASQAPSLGMAGMGMGGMGLGMGQTNQVAPQRSPSPITLSNGQMRTTRKRSSSIRSRAPPAYNPRPRFDPFADERELSIGGENDTPSVIVKPSASAHPTTTAVEDQLALASANSNRNLNHPYTIQIPAANQSEIQRYTLPPLSPRRSPPAPQTRSRVLAHGRDQDFPVSAPVAPAPVSISRPLSPTAPEFTPSRSPSPPKSLSSSAPVSRAGSPPPVAPTSRSVSPAPAIQRPHPLPAPNLSKIVAGILLNRVHAVGKPMRRRVYAATPAGCVGQGQKGYVRSGLSVQCC